jgi:hypothetical protein
MDDQFGSYAYQSLKGGPFVGQRLQKGPAHPVETSESGTRF